MSKPIFNTGERRGMIVVIIILAALIALSYVVNHFHSSTDNLQKEQTDSVIKVLRSQIANNDSASTNDNDLPKNKEKKTSTKKTSTKKTSTKKVKKQNKQSSKTKNNHIERDMLEEALPQN